MEKKKLREIAARYDGEMQLDQNGDFVYVGVEEEDDFQSNNENVARVTQLHAQQRSNEKQKHMEKTKRDKDALEKDKQRKDKTKKATQKREKRRM